MSLNNIPLPDFEKCVYLINDFIDHQTIRNLSDTAMDLFRKEAINLLSVISPELIDKKYINEYMIINFQDNSSSRKNLRLTSLRTILKYLVKQGFINCDIKLRNVKSAAKLPSYVSEDKMQNIINKFKKDKQTNTSIWKGKRDYALLLFMYATGLRASEVVKFQISDLDKGWIRVENGKGRKDRYVPIAQIAINALLDYRKYIPSHIKCSNDEFFITDLLVPFNRLTLNHFCKKSFGINPHLFRHTFATHLITNGCDVYVLSDFLGHSSLSTTQIYANIQPHHLTRTVNNCHPCNSEA